MSSRIIVVMGVAGAGKSTVGQMLATALHYQFLDADSLHPPANIAKMTRGEPLTDEDRAPWLAAVHDLMVHAFTRGDSLVVACSALKQRYRETLACGVVVNWVYLKGSEQVIGARLLARQQHFMKARMLASQFAELEEPSKSVIIDIDRIDPAAAVRQIVDALANPGAKAS